MKPKIRDHYHAHRLSFWLSLIPKLHRQGTTPGIASQHHLLEDHDNPITYDGIVRQGPVLAVGVPARIPSTQLRVNFDRPTVSSGIEISVPHVFDTSSTFYSSSRDDELPQTPIPSSTNVSSSLASSDTGLNLKDSSFTALRVTIIIGCSLLILNLCIFAGVYYQRNENRMDSMLREQQRRDSELESAPSTIKSHIRAPPPSPDLQRALELPQFIPPPPVFIPPVSPTSTPSLIPLQEPQSKSALASEGHHTGTSKVRWAPDVGCEADRDAVWL